MLLWAWYAIRYVCTVLTEVLSLLYGPLLDSGLTTSIYNHIMHRQFDFEEQKVSAWEMIWLSKCSLTGINHDALIDNSFWWSQLIRPHPPVTIRSRQMQLTSCTYDSCNINICIYITNLKINESHRWLGWIMPLYSESGSYPHACRHAISRRRSDNFSVYNTRSR